jgi:hypothetical protein
MDSCKSQEGDGIGRNPRQGTALAPQADARCSGMDLFFVKKQIVVGAVLLGVLELSVMLVNLFSR